MKAMKVMNTILMVGLLLMSAVEAQAVDYKSTYKGKQSQPTYTAPATAPVPVATFRSTSPLPVMMSTESIINADGTVKAEAYGVGEGSSGRPGHIRRDPNNPIVDENDPGNVPLGDGLWVLLLLAGAYVCSRKYARKMIE